MDKKIKKVVVVVVVVGMWWWWLGCGGGDGDGGDDGGWGMWCICPLGQHMNTTLQLRSDEQHMCALVCHRSVYRKVCGPF